jgi:hypothetical protein
MSTAKITAGKVIWSVRTQVEVRQAPAVGMDDNEGGQECLPHTDSGGEECLPHTDCGGQECPPHTEASDLWLYRDRTIALLKRYARMAVETGRLPSLLGRECFRSRVTPYAMASFEDVAIFVHDIERALRRLDEFQQKLIVLNVLEEFRQWEMARLLGCTTRWIEWQLPDAIDELSRILLDCELLRRMPKAHPEACQEGRNGESSASDSNESENNS